MKKILLLGLVLLFMFSVNGNAADIVDWIKGDGTNVLEGTDSPADIDTLITNYLQDPLDRLLSGHISGCVVTVTDDAVLTISAGTVCAQSAGGVKRFRQNTSTVTATNTTSGNNGLDTGSVAANTWYYVYADADADATTFTAILSVNASAPTANCTYSKLIGCALTDGTSDWLVAYMTGTGKTCTVMWDIPIEESTTLSVGDWSAALDCTSSMPDMSRLGIFGVYSEDATGGTHRIWIRPNGSTWNTAKNTGTGSASPSGNGTSGQRICATDTDQKVQYYNQGANDATIISTEGFIFER